MEIHSQRFYSKIKHSQLNVYKEYYVVEKIKIVGATYMAACGLDYTQAAKIGRSAKTALHEEGA